MQKTPVTGIVFFCNHCQADGSPGHSTIEQGIEIIEPVLIRISIDQDHGGHFQPLEAVDAIKFEVSEAVLLLATLVISRKFSQG